MKFFLWLVLSKISKQSTNGYVFHASKFYNGVLTNFCPIRNQATREWSHAIKQKYKEQKKTAKIDRMQTLY